MNAVPGVNALAAWLAGASSYRALSCEGCGVPIVVSRTEWDHPVYVWGIGPDLGAGIVARCPYRLCGLGVTRESRFVVAVVPDSGIDR